MCHSQPTKQLSASSRFGLGVVLLLSAPVGCSSSNDAQDKPRPQPITDVPQSAVENQTLGNCWIYATAGWMESLHLAATSEVIDLSESYWTYWDWYEDIQAIDGNTLPMGGTFRVAAGLALSYGLMLEKDFLPSDDSASGSAAQAKAKRIIEEELRAGRLAKLEDRKDPERVRLVLDEAWGLRPEIREELDRIFGRDGRRTFWTPTEAGGADNADSQVLRTTDLPVKYARFDSTSRKTTFEEHSVDWATAAWAEHTYEDSWVSALRDDAEALQTARRSLQIRVQRALHDRQPVLMAWDVDFNAMRDAGNGKPGSFRLNTLESRGTPGQQGSHLTVLEDYEVRLPDGAVLPAGITLSPAIEDEDLQLKAALAPEASISFFRIKNSWGEAGAELGAPDGFAGYHDLYIDYLNGPIAWCGGGPDAAGSCSGSNTPLDQVILPPGY